MKQLGKSFLPAIFYVVIILISLSSGLSPFGGRTILNTQKIDSNIEKLKQLSWFKSLYEDEKYCSLFFGNRKVRSYLQSSIRVKGIIKNEYAQKRFIALLEKQVQRRNANRKKID